MVGVKFDEYSGKGHPCAAAHLNLGFAEGYLVLAFVLGVI